MWSGKSRPKTGVCFSVKNMCLSLVMPLSTDSGRKASQGGWHSCMLQATMSSSSSYNVQVDTLHEFLNQWSSMTPNTSVLNIIKSHHQLRSHPPLFHNFKQFNSKAVAANHTIIQQEVDEMLAKEAIEPSSGGAGFYLNVFVVPKHTGGLQPIFNFKQFNCYINIPTFKDVYYQKCTAMYSAW